jgi:Flp pilus assembly protein TadG
MTKPVTNNSHPFRRLANLVRDTSGNYALLTALVSPLLLGAGALGTEVGCWMQQHQKMQDAADSAAFAAAGYYGPNPDSVTANGGRNFRASATGIASQYGFTTTDLGANSGGNSTITVAEPATDGPNAGTIGSVEVTITRSYPRMLSALFGNTPVTVRVRAVAKTKGGYGCVLALDATASASAAVQGTPNIALQNCSLFADSNSATAVSGGGSASLSALSIGIVGGITGANNFNTTEGIWTGQPSTSDPFADVNIPSYGGCDYHNYSTKKHDSMNPGVYCGNMHFNGGTTATLADGTYIFEGSSFLVDGGATVTGNHVTLIFTSGNGNSYPNITINGG